MFIRDARDEELPEIGELRVSAYQAGGFLDASSDYAPYLRTVGSEPGSQILVAVAGTMPPEGPGAPGTPDTGRWQAVGAATAAIVQGGPAIVGTVALQFWPDTGKVVSGPGEAEVRALAVAPRAQGSGIGAALVTAIISRARAAGVRHLLLCTRREMRTAHRLYERAGFSRLTERDWSPAPGISLLAYGLELAPATLSPGTGPGPDRPASSAAPDAG